MSQNLLPSHFLSKVMKEMIHRPIISLFCVGVKLGLLHGKKKQVECVREYGAEEDI
jgi:hypothetical protein